MKSKRYSNDSWAASNWIDQQYIMHVLCKL